LDELTTFLDDGGQKAVMKAVKAAVDGPRRVTALWVTHRLEELQWADAASFIDEGQVKISGSPQRVLDHMRRLGAQA
jgi:energy-coupling factor transport system ATP-binding protein